MGGTGEEAGNVRAEQPFSDCSARSCRHHASGQCELYTTSHPPTITVDGRCLGYEPAAAES